MLAQLFRRFVAALTGQNVRFVHAEHAAGDADLRAIATADVVVAQLFNVAKRNTAEAMRADARKIEFPSIFAGFLWPFSGQGGHPANEASPFHRDGPYPSEYGDTFLNRLVAEGVPAREALERYLALDIAGVAHLDRLCELHIAAQASRDERTGFAFARVIEARFRDERLFLTTSHPTLPLLLPLLRGVFERLDAPAELTERAARAQRVTPFPPSELPFHPGVIGHFGLRFVDARSRYRYEQEGRFTFAEFVLRYMECAWNEELVEGLTLARGADAERAHDVLGGALLRSPESATGWRVLSQLRRRLGRLAEAGAAARCGIALDPAEPMGPAELARVKLADGHLADAEAEARRAIALAPADERPHRALADVLAAAGRLADAAAAAEQAAALAPGDPHGLHALAHFLTRLGRLAEAEAALRRAIELDAAPAGFHSTLADLLARQGRTEEALAIPRALLAADPRHAQAHSMTGHILGRENRLAEAEQAFRAAIALDPALDGCHTALAHALLRQQRPAEALAVLRARLAAGSRDPQLHVLTGHILVRQDDDDGAEAAFRAALALDPGLGAEARTWLADIARRRARRAPATVTG